ncbi:trehalose-phosphatase [Streptomyces sp. RFCAC02]|uniref:trehalose-phosphatase n=1 Tax=Streptomyces sp. RFCAC02 TaxID=2499143 RepID=UPI0010215D00|nr:trehalose-phosphatase [Streptomyces sp. RFCAC02]
MGTLPVPATDEGRAGLASLLNRPDRALLAFDFDGTLAPIVADPAQARAHPDAVPALARIAPKIAALAVITGRPADTVVRLGGFDGHPELAGLTVLGAYGAERWDAATGELIAPEPPPGIAAVRAEVDELAARTGSHVEDKRIALAVHTRRAADPEAAFEELSAPLRRLADDHGLTLEPGRMVLELRPPGMDKGTALTELARATGAECVLYGGDDLGDLPAFEAIARLRAVGIPGLRVCSGSQEVARLAAATDLTVDGPEGVAAFLVALAERI